MRLRVSMIVLTGLIVLCGSGCSVSRRSVVKAESLEVRAEISEVRDERLEMMAVDTVKEVTMITVRENEAGDTVMMGRGRVTVVMAPATLSSGASGILGYSKGSEYGTRTVRAAGTEGTMTPR